VCNNSKCRDITIGTLYPNPTGRNRIVITDTLVLTLGRVPPNKYWVPSIRTLLAALLPLWFYIRTAKRSAESYFRLINNPFEIVKNFYSKSDSTESR